MSRYLGAVAVLLFACTPQLDLEIAVDLEDECLLAFPACTQGSSEVPEAYFCEDSSGRRVYGCRVACVAAREISCEVDGPNCLQSAGGDDVMVPVVCVAE